MRNLLLSAIVAVWSVTAMAVQTFVDMTDFPIAVSAASTSQKPMGETFRIGNVSRVIHELGHIDVNGDGLLGPHRVRIYDAVTKAVVAEATVPAGTTAHLVGQWRYAPITGGPVRLEAGKLYTIVGERNGDAYYNYSTVVTPNSFYIGQAPVASDVKGVWGKSDTIFTNYPENIQTVGWTGYGIPNMLTYDETLASNPVPADEALGMGVVNNNSVDVQLQWTAGQPGQNDPPVAKHYVYFGSVSDPNLFASLDAATTTLPITGLNVNTQYYWRVDEGVLINGQPSGPGDPNTLPGIPWSFTTTSPAPLIISQPQNAFFRADDVQVALSLTATDIGPLSYQWQKNGIDISDDAKFQGTQTDTLVVSNPALSDEGSYGCRVSGNGGMIESETAFLVMHRLVAGYPFEQNANDSTGANDGIVFAGLTYTTDVAVTSGGQAYAADPNGTNYVQLPASAYPKPGIGNAMDAGTISFWINYSLTDVGMIAGSFNDGSNTAFGIDIYNSASKNLRLYLRQEGGATITVESPIASGSSQWHYVAISYNNSAASGSSITLYFDGVAVKTGIGPVLDNWAAFQYPLTLMARNLRGVIDLKFTGMLDDFRVYNYVQTPEEIAQVYYDVTGKRSCIYPYANQYDLTGPDGVPDCIVDLYDLTALSSGWLSDGLYPLLN